MYLYSLIDCPLRYITKIFTDNTSFTIFNLLYIRNSYEHVIVLLNVLHGDTCVGTPIPGLTKFFLQTFSFLLIKQLVQGNSRNYTTLHGRHPYGKLLRSISLSFHDPDIFRLDQLA